MTLQKFKAAIKNLAVSRKAIVNATRDIVVSEMEGKLDSSGKRLTLAERRRQSWQDPRVKETEACAHIGFCFGLSELFDKAIAELESEILPGKKLDKSKASLRKFVLWQYVGGLSDPSKMPGYAFGISARDCKTGSRMRKVKGSVCAMCYALQGNYIFENVLAAHSRRFAAMGLPGFISNMSELLNLLMPVADKDAYFRLFDSGDIQSIEMLSDIVAIAKACPQITFWVPTREYAQTAIIQKWHEKFGAFPDNLTIRLSAMFIDGKAPMRLARELGVVGSEVSTARAYRPSLALVVANNGAFECPSSLQGNRCLDCRACWMKSIPVTRYIVHGDLIKN